MGANVFLSHASEDKEFVRRLARDLRRFGASVWVDEGAIHIGDSLLEKIKSGLRAVEFLGIILSPRSTASEWVKREIELALSLEDGRQLKFLPIVIEDCELPKFLEEHRYADFRNPADYQSQMRNVADTLGLDLPKEGIDGAILWRWFKIAGETDDKKHLRNALFGFLTSPGAAGVGHIADVLGGSGDWSDGLREVAAREFLAAMDYEGSQGLAAVRYLKEWGRSNTGKAAPGPLVEALTSIDPVQRLAADLYYQSTGDSIGVGSTAAQAILPDRAQPLHLRVAAANLCTWNILDPVLESIGTEPPELQEELLERLEATSQSTAARSLALPGLELFLMQVKDSGLRFCAAHAVLEIMPKLVSWAQDKHRQTWELSKQVVAEWHSPLKS